MSDETEVVVIDPPQPTGPLRVAIMGNECAMTRAMTRAFDVPRGTEVEVFTIEGDDVDRACEFKPNLLVVTEQIQLKKNDTLNDGDFINCINKVLRASNCGILIRSTLNLETIERLIMALTKPVFDAKIVYVPDVSRTGTEAELIVQDHHFVGGEPDAVNALMGLLKNVSYLSGNITNGTVFEVAFATMGIAGLSAVTSKYFTELQDAVLDVKNANPVTVRRMVETLLSQRISTLPLHVNGVEYDSRLFVGSTDRLTLLENAIGD